MERRKNRMSVGGLRRSDTNTLSVLTQDVLRLPLGQIEPGTLLDLLALSEVPDQLTASLGRELDAFAQQMLREVGDLPDGPPLAEYARELADLPAARAPACLRESVRVMAEDRTHQDAVAALQTLMEGWEAEEPEVLAVPKPSIAPRVASGSVAKLQVVKAPAKPRRTTRAATPAAMVDTRREEWVVEDVVSRLANYGPRGLKEPVVVAGARHRSPWKDMTEAEVLTILRRMKREGRVRFSAGRWFIGG